MRGKRASHGDRFSHPLGREADDPNGDERHFLSVGIIAGELVHGWNDHDADAFLAGGVASRRAGESVHQSRRCEQLTHLARDVGPDVSWRVRDLTKKLAATINQGDDVAEIAAAKKITSAPTLERLELHGEYVDRRCRSNPCPGWKLYPDRVWKRGRLPFIVKSKDVCPGRHGVQNQPGLAMAPATDDSALLVFPKICIAEPCLEVVEVASRGDLDDHVDVIRRTYWWSCGIRDPQSDRGAPDEYDVLDKLAERGRGEL